MVNSKDRFGQARIKVDRANEHINQFREHWEGFQETEFCRIVVKNDPEGSQSIIVEPTDILPAHLVLCSGDAIHNLRSALDFVISEVLGWKNTRLAFPFHESRKSLEDSFRTVPEVIDGKMRGKGSNAPIEEAVVGLGKFIVEEIKPYREADNFLWTINALDRIDKHRLFITVVSPFKLQGFRAVDDYDNVFGGEARIIDDKVVMIQSSQGGIRLEDSGKISAEILFNELRVIEQKPVLTTLLSMRDAVAETINRIEGFLIDHRWGRDV
jgi:hypothetical protein